MGIVDTLWLNTVLTSSSAPTPLTNGSNASSSWPVESSASRNGLAFPPTAKEGEVAEAAPESATGDKEIADEAEKTKAA